MFVLCVPCMRSCARVIIWGECLPNYRVLLLLVRKWFRPVSRLVPRLVSAGVPATVGPCPGWCPESVGRCPCWCPEGVGRCPGWCPKGVAQTTNNYPSATLTKS